MRVHIRACARINTCLSLYAQSLALSAARQSLRAACSPTRLTPRTLARRGAQSTTGPSHLGTTAGSALQGTTPGAGERGELGSGAGGAASTGRVTQGLLPQDGTVGGGGWPGGVPGMTSGTAGTAGSRGMSRSRSGWAAITGPQPRHPYADVEFAPANPKAMSLQKTFKGHLLPVASMALHPTKPILVTASDDKTWKMWHMPAGDLIMCGEGHKVRAIWVPDGAAALVCVHGKQAGRRRWSAHAEGAPKCVRL